MFHAEDGEGEVRAALQIGKLIFITSFNEVKNGYQIQGLTKV